MTTTVTDTPTPVISDDEAAALAHDYRDTDENCSFARLADTGAIVPGAAEDFLFPAGAAGEGSGPFEPFVKLEAYALHHSVRRPVDGWQPPTA